MIPDTPSDNSTACIGFTLVELSVIMLIIALIAGGILLGGDMIEAAKFRAQIRQLETYNTGVNTFRNKYQSIPGDIKAVEAAAINLTPRSGADGHGDGDGKFEGCDGGNMSSPGCEMVLFWRDLSDTHFIHEHFDFATDEMIDPQVAYAQKDWLAYFPRTHLSDSYWVPVTNPVNLTNWFLADHIGCCGWQGGNPIAVHGGHLTARDAYRFDVKIDDGSPMTGRVIMGAYDTMLTWPFTTHVFGNPNLMNPGCVGGNQYLVNNPGLHCIFLHVRMGG